MPHTQAMDTLYTRLITSGCGDDFDRHIFACILSVGRRDASMPLTVALGLTRTDLAELLGSYFPDSQDLLADVPADRGADALEEPDLRNLLLTHGTRESREERWLAAIVARRAVWPNHLWQDLGLTARQDLSHLLHRHFHPLATKNVRNMKWKKFFYRQMCEAEKILICKSPVCDQCPDFPICFAQEE